jgi:serine/threonine protein kinase
MHHTVADTHSDGRYYALKVLKAGDNRQGPNELKVHQLLGDRSTDVKAYDSIVRLMDSFQHQGPNGTHLCIVLEAMGPTAASMLDELPCNLPRRLRHRSRYPFWMAKRVLHQTLLGLRALHSKGLAHGDLQPGNILFAVQDLRSVALEKLRQDVDDEETIFGPLKRTDGEQDRWAPHYLASSLPLADYVDTGPLVQVKLSDLGAGTHSCRSLQQLANEIPAYEISNPPESFTTPLGLRAPELIVGEKLGETADIWSFGCLVYEFVTGRSLFAVIPLASSDASEVDEDHQLQMTRLLGPPPEELYENWICLTPKHDVVDRKPNDSDEGSDNLGAEGSYGDGMGSSPGLPNLPQSLEEAFERDKSSDLSDEDARKTVALVRGILQYETAKRPSIEALLTHSWFSHN